MRGPRTSRRRSRPMINDSSSAPRTPAMMVQVSAPVRPANQIMITATRALTPAAAMIMIAARRTGRRCRLSPIGLATPGCANTLSCPSHASSGSGRNQSVRKPCGERVWLRYAHGSNSTVMDSGEPPALSTSYGNQGVASQAAFRQSGSPRDQDRAVAVEHRNIVSDITN